MALACKCDICGKYFDPYGYINVVYVDKVAIQNKVVTNNCGAFTDINHGTKYELCEMCAESLNDWLNVDSQ